MPGVEPGSRTLFSLLHTAITYSIYLFVLKVKQSGITPYNIKRVIGV